MMTAATADLQKAIFTALLADTGLVAVLGGGKVFDHAPASVAFPYVTLGRASVYDWSTATEPGTEQLLTLHVWSKARGKKEALDIMERVRLVLDGAPLDLDGHQLIDLRLVYSEARYDDDIDVYHGQLRFRAVTEGAA
jgi:hypothetical protein